MIGGETGAPPWKSTGPGTPIPTPAGRTHPAPPGPCEQLERLGQHVLGAEPDVHVDVLLAQHRQPAVSDGHRHGRGPDRDTDEAHFGGQIDQCRASSATRGGRSGPLGQAEFGQPGDLAGHRGARDASRSASSTRDNGPSSRSILSTFACVDVSGLPVSVCCTRRSCHGFADDWRKREAPNRFQAPFPRPRSRRSRRCFSIAISSPKSRLYRRSAPTGRCAGASP